MYHDAAGVIEDYDSLPMPSLLKTNLGLQQHRYIRYIGPSDELDPDLLALRPVDTKQEIQFSNGTNCRRVSRHTHFALVPYSRTRVRAQEIQELDTIEKIVAPHGKSLVKLYFRMVHPCFPILDKKFVSLCPICPGWRSHAALTQANLLCVPSEPSWRSTHVLIASSLRLASPESTCLLPNGGIMIGSFLRRRSRRLTSSSALHARLSRAR